MVGLNLEQIGIWKLEFGDRLGRDLVYELVHTPNFGIMSKNLKRI
jgi:hypothetical protein